MELKGSILAVESNGGLLTTLDLLLKKHFTKVISVVGLDEMFSILNTHEIDVLVLDLSVGSNSDESVVTKISTLYPQVEIVLLSSLAQAARAIVEVKNGAFDYITKPWNNDKLVIAVKNAFVTGKLKKDVDKIALIKSGFKEVSNYFWGISSVMKQVYEVVHKAAYSEAPVLIKGELGCGKQQIAKEIHSISVRNSSFIVSMDAGDLSDDEFPTALLGKEGESVIGKLELAHDGTLFINNIDKLSLYNQKLLLNIIKTKIYNKINGNISSIVSSRFLFGCSCDLEEMVLSGKFLEELYNRLNVIQIDMPPLRERREDIPALATVFLEKYCKKFSKKIKGFSKPAVEFLTTYNWPGNVSELAVTIEKAVILCDKTEITPLHFQSIADQMPNLPREIPADNQPVSLLSLIGNDTLEQMEMRIIKAVLLRNRGNMSLTAKQLGITRQTLYNKGEKYGLID